MGSPLLRDDECLVLAGVLLWGVGLGEKRGGRKGGQDVLSCDMSCDVSCDWFC